MMSRTQLACYALIASACLLAGLAVIELADRFEPAAEAEMVVNKDIFTILSDGGVQSGEEFVYLLDNKNERLLCYQSGNNNRIELYGTLDVSGAIQQALRAGGGGGGRGGR